MQSQPSLSSHSSSRCSRSRLFVDINNLPLKVFVYVDSPNRPRLLKMLRRHAADIVDDANQAQILLVDPRDVPSRNFVRDWQCELGKVVLSSNWVQYSISHDHWPDESRNWGHLKVVVQGPHENVDDRSLDDPDDPAENLFGLKQTKMEPIPSSSSHSSRSISQIIPSESAQYDSLPPQTPLYSLSPFPSMQPSMDPSPTTYHLLRPSSQQQRQDEPAFQPHAPPFHTDFPLSNQHTPFQARRGPEFSLDPSFALMSMTNDEERRNVQDLIHKTPNSQNLGSPKIPIFQKPSGKSAAFFVQIELNNRKNTTNIIKRNGGTIVSAWETCDYAILDPRKGPTFPSLSPSIAKARKPIVTQTWVARCEEMGALLPTTEFEIAPFEKMKRKGGRNTLKSPSFTPKTEDMHPADLKPPT